MISVEIDSTNESYYKYIESCIEHARDSLVEDLIGLFYPKALGLIFSAINTLTGKETILEFGEEVAKSVDDKKAVIALAFARILIKNSKKNELSDGDNYINIYAGSARMQIILDINSNIQTVILEL